MRFVLIYSALACAAAVALYHYADAGGTHWPLLGTPMETMAQPWGTILPLIVAAPPLLWALRVLFGPTLRPAILGSLAAGIVMAAWTIALMPVLG